LENKTFVAGGASRGLGRAAAGNLVRLSGRGEGPVYGDVDARHPGSIHPVEGYEVPSGVHHGYVHRPAHLLCLLRCGEDDLSRLF
jgi:hypothetical protein